MESAQEILQRLLDERYEAGREAGYDEGLKTGYEKALFEVQDFVEAQLAPPPKLALADHPGDENDADLGEVEHAPDPAPTIADKVGFPPYLRLAYRRLMENPGITSRAARDQWGGSNSVLYQLAKLGLAEKRGSQFYAKEGAAG